MGHIYPWGRGGSYQTLRQKFDNLLDVKLKNFDSYQTKIEQKFC